LVIQLGVAVTTLAALGRAHRSPLCMSRDRVQVRLRQVVGFYRSHRR